MTSDYAFLTLLLLVKLLFQISYTVAVSLGGFLGSVFERIDFLSTFREFGLKLLGLTSGKSVGDIAKDIFTVGVTLGFGFYGFLQSGVLFFFRRLCFFDISEAFIHQLRFVSLNISKFFSHFLLVGFQPLFLVG